MTFEEIHSWCVANGADLRGIQRGKDFFIRCRETKLPDDLPSLSEIFHWDLALGDSHYVLSPSDLERVMSGRMSLSFYTEKG